MHLHNFVITERIKQTGATKVDFGSEIDNWSPEVDLGYLPVHCEKNTHSGYSFVREKMVQHIVKAGGVRPAPVPRKKSKKLRVQYKISTVSDRLHQRLLAKNKNSELH